MGVLHGLEFRLILGPIRYGVESEGFLAFGVWGFRVQK